MQGARPTSVLRNPYAHSESIDEWYRGHMFSKLTASF